MKSKRASTFLEDFLLVAPLSHALWRSTEALSFSKIEVKKPVLDLGCGFGEFSGVVYGNLECGIDINTADLELAMKGKRYKRVVHADARNLPFATGEFSTVISVSVIEHIKGAEKVISEVGKILKKGGFFIFSVPTTEFYTSLLVPKLCKLVGLPFLGSVYIELHKKAFNHETIRSLDWWKKKLQDSGFRVVKSEGTISHKLAQIHEIFLITALPSQIWRWLFGKRLVIFPWRTKVLPRFFSKYVYTDKSSGVNVFFVAQKI